GAARFAGIEAVYGSDSSTPTLSGNVRQVGTKTFADRFDVVIIGSPGYQAQERCYITPLCRDQTNLIRRQTRLEIATLFLNNLAFALNCDRFGHLTGLHRKFSQGQGFVGAQDYFSSQHG